ncbi:helix-turn-helix domain-containing protein [Ottowia thiooxydans]|uniref:helix-turn-helix domain-containing protein n=1 Tax=Ottowia thiooxydans TaxID=219182 RepID=UPI0004141B7D|nr:helix-turn-helix domain-containing protein [Ottowia thiooxydans]
MIENDSTPSTSEDHAPANTVNTATADLSAGAMLRQMRESAGVHAAVLASVLKVPQQKLEALESDDLDQLPDVTFARGLAAAICRAFGADPAPVLARMPAAAHGLRAQSPDVKQAFRRAGDRPTPMLNSGVSKPLLIAVGLLLAGAALLWLLPTLPIQLGAPSTTVNSDGSVSESVTPGPPVEAVAPAEPPMAVAPAEPASTPMAPTPVPVSPDQLLVVTASSETWVTVRDSAGKQVLNRAVAAGETVAAGGALPLTVTIGRKDAVTVKVRGQPYDLKSAGKSNVARFQVE